MPVFVSPGETLNVGDIALLLKDAVIKGRVHNESGDGVPRVSVMGRQPEGFGQGLREAAVLTIMAEHCKARSGDGSLDGLAHVIAPGFQVRRRHNPAYKIAAGNLGNHLVRLSVSLRTGLHS